MGSTLELEYHLLLAKDLGYLEKVEDVQLRAKVHELKSMLSTLLRKVKSEAAQ
jgi:four helix bundle protein